MTRRLVALGDSFSCGEGVGLLVPQPQTWVGLLARSREVELTCLAQPGATLPAVRQRQLPDLPRADLDVVTILIGLNDIVRGGFDPAGFGAELGAVVACVRSTNAPLLLVRLHDPCRHLPIAGPLRRWVAGRVDAINAAVDAVAATDPGTMVLDLDRLAELRSREAWAVDRLHPSSYGHSVIAAAAARLLATPPQPLVQPTPTAGRAQEAAWVLRHAVPWSLAKSYPVGRYLVRRALPLA